MTPEQRRVHGIHEELKRYHWSGQLWDDLTWLFSTHPHSPGRTSCPADPEATPPQPLLVRMQGFSKEMERLMADLNQVFADWNALRDAVRAKLQANADEITKLQDQIKEAAADGDEEKLGELDNQMKDLLAQVTGVLDQTPAPAPSAAADPAAAPAGSSVTGGTDTHSA